MSSIEERSPMRAGLNACERIKRITEATKKLSETPHAELLLDAVHDQVADELAIVERALMRLGQVA